MYADRTLFWQLMSELYKTVKMCCLPDLAFLCILSYSGNSELYIFPWPSAIYTFKQHFTFSCSSFTLILSPSFKSFPTLSKNTFCCATFFITLVTYCTLVFPIGGDISRMGVNLVLIVLWHGLTSSNSTVQQAPWCHWIIQCKWLQCEKYSHFGFCSNWWGKSSPHVWSN